MQRLQIRSISLAALVLAISISAPPLEAAAPSYVFTGAQTISGLTTWAEHLATVDYDHDGKLDLVGVLRDDATSARELYWWRGAGDGTFGVGTSLSMSGATDVDVADLNGDGLPDLFGGLVREAWTTPFRIWVRLGSPTGFQLPIYNGVATLPSTVRAATLDSDDKPDVVVANATGFALLKGVGNGTFYTTTTQSIDLADFANGITTGDFDGDGITDVAVSERSSLQLAIFFRQSDGTLSRPLTLPTGSYPGEPEAADFNEDGLADLVSANWETGTIDVFLTRRYRDGAQRFTLAANKPGTHGGGASALRVIDLNRDGHVDIVCGGVNNPVVLVYLGLGDGSFAAPSVWETGDSSFAFAVGDFNGDSLLDLASGGYGQILVALGSFTSQMTAYTESPVISLGQPAPLRASIAGISKATDLPRGTVTFKEGETTLGVVDVGSSGVASLQHDGLPLGAHTITATFSGSAGLDGRTATFEQKVSSATTSTTLVLPSHTISYGSPLTFTISIESAGTATSSYCILSVDGVESEVWSARPVTLNLSMGQHQLHVRSLGTTWDPPSESTVETVTVVRAIPEMVKAGGSTFVAGGDIDFRIIVSGSRAGMPTPTGTIDLRADDRGWAVGALSAGSLDFRGSTARGIYHVVAKYGGDANYAPASLSFRVAVVPNFNVAIEAHSFHGRVTVDAVVPQNASALQLQRSTDRVSWTAVPEWTVGGDDPSPLNAGVPYYYRLTCMVDGIVQTSNLDVATIFTDDPLVPGETRIKRIHFDELRTAINALRGLAALPPFDFDPSYQREEVRLDHVLSMQTPVAEVRSRLGMGPFTPTDFGTITNLTIKALHIEELRDGVR